MYGALFMIGVFGLLAYGSTKILKSALAVPLFAAFLGIGLLVLIVRR